jgi:hypothetical protein
LPRCWAGPRSGPASLCNARLSHAVPFLWAHLPPWPRSAFTGDTIVEQVMNNGFLPMLATIFAFLQAWQASSVLFFLSDGRLHLNLRLEWAGGHMDQQPARHDPPFGAARAPEQKLRSAAALWTLYLGSPDPAADEYPRAGWFQARCRQGCRRPFRNQQSRLLACYIATLAKLGSSEDPTVPGAPGLEHRPSAASDRPARFAARICRQMRASDLLRDIGLPHNSLEVTSRCPFFRCGVCIVKGWHHINLPGDDYERRRCTR